ncbi:cycloartenol synthase-like protein [Planctopirus limnophila DSM 3776]|uniref:Cycloartenol synthase-like protein n=1 Tax=Planctopirus limnophila (strain ATCC 43296 / DSM 3776 / IFAM 1008 / Mu 290) TaxID=521674 RepID=D5SY66_PLAL2|nr:prenyltransferase/squalene oxidase repeat-containing protein [Planctopirus limnophila]ADG69859.1 cycloartenol synthase-like protein [Planctopirus limnophila DSM 3776]
MAQISEAATPAEIAASRQKAIAFLKTSQAEDGSWTTNQTPGITGLVLYGALSAGAAADDPMIVKGLKYLESYRQPDGGIYSPKAHHGNYETAISLLAFSAANSDGKYNDLIKKAEAYIRGVQWDQSEKIESSDVRWGGAGYGKTNDRPDLSNTAFFLEALQTAGVKSDDQAVQNALVFLSRCQNLESEYNTTPAAAKINDGGFYYTPALGGQSQAGTTPEGGLRSYGSMTYAGLKSMIYAGLSKDDPRVKAATEWIRKFYTVDENPGLGDQGIYYYHQAFAKALNALGEEVLIDAQGKEHRWREDLANALIGKQQANGSWVNKNSRWMEGDPNLATAYALMALKYATK